MAYQSSIDKCRAYYRQNRKKWLITGVAGFIGSNLLEELLKLEQVVIGIDNLSTGHIHNLEDVKQVVSPAQWINFTFIKGDLCDLDICRVSVKGCDYVLHQAALGSVPRSIKDPVTTNLHNVSGFINIITAAKEAMVKRFTYASSSSVYGDHPSLPKQEDIIGHPLSPYAVSKYVGELYGRVFQSCYELDSIGLRYFNIFGRRQDPNGSYAAVIPRWIQMLLEGRPVTIFGDGQSSRDFCYVENAIQANLLACFTESKESLNQVYNVAVGDQTSLKELHDLCVKIIEQKKSDFNSIAPLYQDFRAGDIRHSKASIDKASTLLGYVPSFRIAQGLEETINWYLKKENV